MRAAEEGMRIAIAILYSRENLLSCYVFSRLQRTRQFPPITRHLVFEEDNMVLVRLCNANEVAEGCKIVKVIVRGLERNG